MLNHFIYYIYGVLLSCLSESDVDFQDNGKKLKDTSFRGNKQLNLIKSTVLRRRTTLARICWSNVCAAAGAEMTVRFGKRL